MAKEEMFGWFGEALTQAKAMDELLVADSWLVDNGRVHGFEPHRAVIMGACRAVAGAAVGIPVGVGVPDGRGSPGRRSSTLPPAGGCA